jgi:hypothetical protein
LKCSTFPSKPPIQTLLGEVPWTERQSTPVGRGLT